jgi:hypothetical protein
MGYGKNGSPGAKDEKWPKDYLDVEDGVLILIEKQTPGAPRMGSGSLEKRTIYSCRAHIATSFVPIVRVIGREIFRGDLEISGE